MIDTDSEDVFDGKVTANDARIEEEPQGIEPTIRVVGLKKVYGMSFFKKLSGRNFVRFIFVFRERNAHSFS